MNKIVIIGSPGAGKSTFAQQLGQVLKTEVFHLDRYFWRSGWQEYSREERIRIQQDLMCGKERWIMEGSYISSADGRLNAADTIIFLDMPRYLCLWRVIKRHITTYRQHARPDIPEGCTDRVDLICIMKILAFPHRGRVLLREKIHERKRDQGERKEIYTLCSNEHIQAFLQKQAAGQSQANTYAARDSETTWGKLVSVCSPTMMPIPSTPSAPC